MKLKLAILFAILFCGCAAVEDAYVAADRATYEVIAPEYGRYVEADTLLTPEQKGRRFDKLSTWNLRIKAAEGTP